jgi:hypothetical protein
VNLQFNFEGTPPVSKTTDKEHLQTPRHLIFHFVFIFSKQWVGVVAPGT